MTDELKNSPPEIRIGLEIDDLEIEARNFLDGEEITSQGQADALAAIVRQMQDKIKQLEAARKAEKKPFDDGAKAVQERFNPVKAKGERIIAVANKPITDWLVKLQAERDAEAERLRKEAEQACIDADRVAAETRSGDLDAATEAEAAIANAARATRIATAAGNKKAHATGTGKAMHLRTSWEPEITDKREAMKWAADRRNQAWNEGLDALLLQLAKEEVRSGVRDIPGFVIHERKQAA